MTAEFREFLYPHRAIEQKFKEDGLCSAVSRMWQWNSQQQYNEYKARYNETQRCIEELEARREILTAKYGKLLGYLDMLRKQGPIRAFKGRRVPILLWAISPDCEVTLDRYEGWPVLYRKETLLIQGITWMLYDITEMPTDVTKVQAMIYIMSQGHPAPPSIGYLDTIERGCRAVGFHLRYLVEGIRRTQRL